MSVCFSAPPNWKSLWKNDLAKYWRQTQFEREVVVNECGLKKLRSVSANFFGAEIRF